MDQRQKKRLTPSFGPFLSAQIFAPEISCNELRRFPSSDVPNLLVLPTEGRTFVEGRLAKKIRAAGGVFSPAAFYCPRISFH
jgi:hypothetical protein